MADTKASLPGRRALARAILLATLVLSCAPVAHAQSLEEPRGEPTDRRMSAGPPPRRGAPRAASRAALANGPVFYNATWLGHSVQTVVPGTPSTYSFGRFRVGRGNNKPGPSASAADNSGVWTWDNFAPGETDSLQGWRFVRRPYTITGGLTFNDTDRPWWAVDVGNVGNAAPIGSQGRTVGVLSYWHVDGGSKNNPPPFNGNALPAMTWAPLAGNGSAWCGVRAHGDFTYADPVTGNPYNASVLDLADNVPGSLTTTKKFPGYPGQMDQMLYRDVEITGSGATLDLSFLYRTAMSTGTTTTAATRTGWFQFDPTVVGPVAAPGPHPRVPNFISNTAIGQPADSFMVYVGVPVNIDDLTLADGTHKTAGATPHAVYDLRRRWLSEVLALDKPIVELLHVGGTVTSSYFQPGIGLDAFYNAQSGSPRYLRLVFRVKTNRGFDDMSGSNSGAYSSGGVGAALVDEVTIGGSGVAGAALGTSGFESPSDIDNSDGPDPGHALAAWRATGKPPATYFHAHPLAGGDLGGGNLYDPLLFQDVCGTVGTPGRQCAMAGVVISAGDHDRAEAIGGATPASAERERMDGMLSPTILLASVGTGDFNACGVDLPTGTANDDYYVWADVYTAQSDPGRQSDGVTCWGDLRIPGFQLFEPDVKCFQVAEGLINNGLIRTATSFSHPDSLRIFLGANQQCFRFAVTGAACTAARGLYFDNVSFLISDDNHGDPAIVPFVDPWRWISDAFPVNDGTSLVPGVAVAPGTAGFDTAAAYIKSGLNVAQSTVDVNRFTIPGDSVAFIGIFGGSDRLDMVFRILPGVGNYHVVGDPASGLRPVPTDPVNVVTAGDNSFWGQYLADPGVMSKGVHGNPGVAGPGGGANWWSKNVWNSARLDTADINIFPVMSNAAVFNTITFFNNFAMWMSCYHESDPKYAILGIPHNRCFLVNPAGANNSTNITCSGAPPGYGANEGYDGNPTTREGTKIIPDGQLTPGAHVEYFLRAQADGPRDNVNFTMSPDTNLIIPQYTSGFDEDDDAHRWQQFGVLPDRWKEGLFGGSGMACMLYVDQADQSGNERVFVSVADSIGMTDNNHRGAHNGWRARGDQPIEYVDVTFAPSLARYDHGGQPGTTWDMFGVRGGQSTTASAGHLGDRMGRQADGLATGKDARLGPTPAMLRTYYKVLLFLTSDVSSAIFGRYVNNGQDDVALLHDFIRNPAPGTSNTTKRAVIVEGSGFVQSEFATGSVAAYSDHLALLRDDLGVLVKTDAAGNPEYSYQFWSGNHAARAGLTTADPGPIAGGASALDNNCLWGHDVLDVAPGGAAGQPASYYENTGVDGPYIASVYSPRQQGVKPSESFVDGWNIEHQFNANDGSTWGRLGYIWRLLGQAGSQVGCSLVYPFAFPLDVPGQQGFVNFMRLINNPLARGDAVVRFGLARGDRVTARIYDVAGRIVRTLADRNFDPGEHELRWDGADDQGRRMARGVYFTRLRYATSRFDETRKLIVLR
jgi:hypothetical protein